MEKKPDNNLQHKLVDIWQQVRGVKIDNEVVEKSRTNLVITNDDTPTGQLVKVVVEQTGELVDNVTDKLGLPTLNISPWAKFWLIFSLIFGGGGLTSFFLLTTVPSATNCQQITPFSADSERLYCAKVAAESGKNEEILAGIELVRNWSNNHPLYSDGQKLLRDLSIALTHNLRQQLKGGNLTLEEAIALLKKIPEHSPTHKETSATIASWENQNTKGRDIEAKFQLALKEARWLNGFEYLQIMRSLPGTYWSNVRHQDFAMQIAREKDAWEKLDQAKKLVYGRNFKDILEKAENKEIAKNSLTITKDPKILSEAVTLITTIDKKTYVNSEVQTEKINWSRELLNLAVIESQKGKYTEAVKLIKKIPQDVPTYKEGQDWLRLNQAQESAQIGKPVNLIDATSTIKTIPSNSPVYPIAQKQKNNWQNQLQDYNQLNWSKLLASVPQPETLDLAINTAGTISPQSINQSEAKVAIAQWENDRQLIGNRNILAQARQIASSDQLNNLKNAVNIASQIKNNQPLYGDANNQIKAWNNKIQIKEDQPILDTAEAFAKRGDLPSAIRTANQINTDRLLYATAKTRMANWNIQLQKAEDEQIIKQAKNLYNAGQITSAIQIASSIKTDRPRYNEAQSLVTNWVNSITSKPLPKPTN